MLPAAARLTCGESFRRCVRAGRRAGSRTLVLHLDARRGPTEGSVDRAGDRAVDRAVDPAPGPARVGFVVSRAIGGAVMRNRVRRRLRHLVREQLADLPAASVVVVRALPAAAGATYAELRADLGRCLGRVVPAHDPQAAAPSVRQS